MALVSTASTLRKPLDRRTFLRGSGALLALPWLEAMAPVRGPGERPLGFVCLYVPNGMLPSAWVPKGEALSPTLAPLAPVQDRCVVLGNLFHRESRAGEGHYVKLSAFLSGAPVRRTGGRDLQVGTSLDQVLAQRVGRTTPIDSLVLGIEPPMNRVDMGYSTVYGAHISWLSPTQPATRELSPRAVFDRLVRWSSGARDAQRRAVLDIVREEARTLHGRLGAADGHKLGEYLAAVHALDARIAAFEGKRRSLTAEAPADDAVAFQERVALMLELVALALEAELTRVATFMFGNAVSGRDFSFLDGVDGGHHHLSHHEDRPELEAQYARINRWHTEQCARFLGRLARTSEGDSDLLARTVVLYGSGLADGNRHVPDDLPLVLAGGPFRGGRHLRQTALTPLCNLYLSIERAFGLADPSFGDSTGELQGLA